jgi:toxin ParE1/3/4
MILEWSQTALVQLADQLEYVAVDNPGASRRLRERVFAAVESLLDFPEIGRPGDRRGTRELVVTGTPYLVVYEYEEPVIRILRVWHARQDWKRR